MSYKVSIYVASGSVAGCGLLWLIWGIYLYWSDIRLVNFLAAWIPFVLSILLAFVPEHTMTRPKKYLWRSGVIAVGFIWSVVLWHQQVVADNTAKQDQARIVSQAVSESNQHSDGKIGQVEGDLQSTRADLEARIDKVPQLLTKTESDLNSSISKVGTAPVKYAQLQFEIFDPTASVPRMSQTISPDDNGVYTLDFGVTNVSDTAASSGEIWVHICDQCAFSEEPNGFDRPNGLDERSRHKLFQNLNPGVSLERMTIKFKIAGGPFAFTDVFFNYSCASCGKIAPPQSIRNFLLQPFHTSKFN